MVVCGAAAPGDTLGCSKPCVHVASRTAVGSSLFSQRYLGSFVFSYLVILSAKWDSGFAACRLFPSCGIGACRVVSSLEIAGIADSQQNSVRAVHRNLAQPLKPQSNPPPRLLFLIKHA